MRDNARRDELLPMTTRPEETDGQAGGARWRGPAGLGRTLLLLLPLLAAHVVIDVTALSGGLIALVFWPALLAGYAAICLLVWFVGTRAARWSARKAALTGVAVYLFVAIPLSAAALALLNDALTP